MMPPSLLIVLLLFCFFAEQSLVSSNPENSDLSSRLTVVGVVYCDTCSVNTFSRKSYFLPGVEVHIVCKFKANSPKTAEEVNISVNRTTGRNGVYKLEVPHVDGVDCVDGIALASQCQANLIENTAQTCNIPVFKTSTNEISIKSKQDKLCIYSLGALSYKPSIKDDTLCGKPSHQEAEKTVNESKFFWPYSPPYWFPWPYPSLPPLPTLPPFPNLPFPPLPSTNPPPLLPFPFPTLPPFPAASPPPPPAFDWRNPRTWTPYLPPFPPTNNSQNQEP